MSLDTWSPGLEELPKPSFAALIVQPRIIIERKRGRFYGRFRSLLAWPQSQLYSQDPNNQKTVLKTFYRSDLNRSLLKERVRYCDLTRLQNRLQGTVWTCWKPPIGNLSVVPWIFYNLKSSDISQKSIIFPYFSLVRIGLFLFLTHSILTAEWFLRL